MHRMKEQQVKRAILIVKYLRKKNEQANLSELSEQIDLGLSSTSRLIKELTRIGIMERNSYINGFQLGKNADKYMTWWLNSV